MWRRGRSKTTSSLCCLTWVQPVSFAVDLLRHGFIRAVQCVLRCMEDALVHGGPPCSSWIFMNRGTSCRAREYPRGDSDEPSVRTANTLLGMIMYL